MKAVLGIDDRVWVRLTEVGKNRLADWQNSFKNAKGETVSMAPPGKERGGWVVLSPAVLMAIFGPVMAPGNPKMFVDDEISLIEPLEAF